MPKKPAAKKAPAKKPAAQKAPAKKPAPKNTAAKKPAAKRAAVKPAPKRAACEAGAAESRGDQRIIDAVRSGELASIARDAARPGEANGAESGEEG